MKTVDTAKSSERRPNQKRGKQMKRNSTNKVVVVGLARKDCRLMLSHYKANGGNSERLVSDLEDLVRSYEIEIADSLEEPESAEAQKPIRNKEGAAKSAVNPATDKGSDKVGDKAGGKGGSDKGGSDKGGTAKG